LKIDIDLLLKKRTGVPSETFTQWNQYGYFYNFNDFHKAGVSPSVDKFTIFTDFTVISLRFIPAFIGGDE